MQHTSFRAHKCLALVRENSFLTFSLAFIKLTGTLPWKYKINSLRSYDGQQGNEQVHRSASTISWKQSKQPVWSARVVCLDSLELYASKLEWHWVVCYISSRKCDHGIRHAVAGDRSLNNGTTKSFTHLGVGRNNGAKQSGDKVTNINLFHQYRVPIDIFTRGICSGGVLDYSSSPGEKWDEDFLGWVSAMAT